MSVTLVDTNVLLDLVTDDPQWADWSIEQMESAALTGPLVINDIVYAEILSTPSCQYDSRQSKSSRPSWTKPASP
ncbi:MAG: type II toxin-antitoxin system VapC family toxin [Acetobacteraceae bacterium]